MHRNRTLNNCLLPSRNISNLNVNVFQSWYTLGSIYSNAFKTQSEFYHKLNTVANDCQFANKEEIVKFLFVTHNQNTCVREHLLKAQCTLRNSPNSILSP